jgi:hypothetical protein
MSRGCCLLNDLRLKWKEIAIEVEIDAEAWSDSVLLEK